MRLYYITDRRQFPGGPADQRCRLLEQIARVAGAGVDYIQLRERGLTTREFEQLGRDAVAVVRSAGTRTQLLINSRIDVALACGADGVHLRSDDVRASDARAMTRRHAGFVLGVSCHSAGEVKLAWSHGADFAVFGPVFEKNGQAGNGLKALQTVCASVPGFVFALGGVTTGNAADCVRVGAAGVAGIRLFQDAAAADQVRQLGEAEISKSG